ncbi:histidine phosphatase family protein [Phaeospirillum tilakii]|uniref:Histidine phosphatase family protein n=1 Tax=Phaeospirillum tilakii TaxID=741673 RepID=A0ABW5CI89_9PROT
MILVRHTTPAGAEGRCYGRLDLPVSESRFEAEAAQTAAALPPGPKRIYASPSLRCRLLAERLGAPVTFDERLLELDFGAWEGLRWEAIPRDQLAAWCEDFVEARPPGGETFVELAARAEACAAEIEAAAGGAEPVLVTHSGVIRALLTRARGLPLAAAFDFEVAYGSVHRR